MLYALPGVVGCICFHGSTPVHWVLFNILVSTVLLKFTFTIFTWSLTFLSESGSKSPDSTNKVTVSFKSVKVKKFPFLAFELLSFFNAFLATVVAKYISAGDHLLRSPKIGLPYGLFVLGLIVFVESWLAELNNDVNFEKLR